jgi:hypothetical protein
MSADMKTIIAKIETLERAVEKAERLGRPRHFDISQLPWRRRFAWMPVTVPTMRSGDLEHKLLWLGWFYQRPDPFNPNQRWAVSEKDAARNPRFWGPPPVPGIKP